MRGPSPASISSTIKVDDVTRREVLARVLVQRLVELADQLLEDRAHGRVVDRVGMQVHGLEALEHLESVFWGRSARSMRKNAGTSTTVGSIRVKSSAKSDTV